MVCTKTPSQASAERSAVANTSATGKLLPWLEITTAGFEIWVLSKNSATAPVTSIWSPTATGTSGPLSHIPL